MPEPGGEVWGALWLIASREADALDAQEGVDARPPRYRRVEIEVERPSGERAWCLAYRVASPGAGAELPPSRDYRDTMCAGPAQPVSPTPTSRGSPLSRLLRGSVPEDAATDRRW